MYYKNYELMVRGDPGFFGNLFHAVTGVIGGAVKGFITGGPIGAVGGAVGGAIHATASNIGSSTLEAGGSQTALTPELIARHRAAVARGRAAIPGGAPRAAIGAGGGERGGSRRMNWANHRALSRAERRIHAAVKHFSKYIRWVHPTKAGHAAPRFGKHRASPYPKVMNPGSHGGRSAAV